MARSKANDRATELTARTGPTLGIQDQGSNMKEAQPSNLYLLMEFREDRDGEVFFCVVNYDMTTLAWRRQILGHEIFLVPNTSRN
jgi:hypothetical protein